MTSIYEQFLQPDDLSAKHGQLLVLDLLYLLVAQENFDRSSAKLAASALAVSSHRRPRRTPPRAAAAVPGGIWRWQSAGCTTGGRPVTESAVAPVVSDFANEVSRRLERLASLAADGGLDAAIGLMTRAIETGAVIQAFGTGHSEAFAMEIAGRAGGLIPTNKIALRDLVLHGSLAVDALAGSSLERNPDIVAELWEISPIHPGDVFVIASNSGVNGSVVGMALLAKEKGHDVIAVTSLQHTAQVRPKHPSGRRLSEIADVVIDNLAPYGDATLALPGGVAVGSVSSITSAFIAQLLTIGVAERMNVDGRVPPLYLSANIPGGDEHNHALERKYEGRIRRVT